MIVVVLCLLVLLGGCTSTGLVDEQGTDTLFPPQTGETQNDDNQAGNDLSRALECDLGSVDTVPNRIVDVCGLLEGNLTATEREFLRLVFENPHNIWPQIQEAGVYTDGDVTAEEFRNTSDKDDDGLIRAKELDIGTDPNDPDTDGDQLLDGWEYVEGVVINGTYNPLPGADPLHKDLYLLQLPIDGRLPKDSTAMTQYVDRYNNSPVTNPDGEKGIDVHVEIQEVHLDRYEGLNNRGDLRDPLKSHDLRSTHYLLAIKDTDTNYAWGGGGRIIIGSVDPSLEGIDETVDHETIHSLVGELDEEKQEPDDPHHPNDEYEPLYVTNPDIAEEINRDGMMGLEEPEDWRLPDATSSRDY